MAEHSQSAHLELLDWRGVSVGRVTPVVCPVLVGRSEERARLTAALDALGVSRGQAIALSGEAGIGKSRLLTELVAEAHERGTPVLQMQCFEQDRAFRLPAAACARIHCV